MMKINFFIVLFALASLVKASQQRKLRGNKLENKVNVHRNLEDAAGDDAAPAAPATYECIFDLTDLDSISLPDGIIAFNLRVSNRYLKTLRVFSFPTGFGSMELISGDEMTLNQVKSEISSIEDWHLIAVQEYFDGETPSVDGNSVIQCPAFPTTSPSASPTVTAVQDAEVAEGSEVDDDLPERLTPPPSPPPTDGELDEIYPDGEWPSVTPTDIPSIPPHVKERMQQLRASATGATVPDAASNQNVVTTVETPEEDSVDLQNSTSAVMQNLQNLRNPRPDGPSLNNEPVVPYGTPPDDVTALEEPEEPDESETPVDPAPVDQVDAELQPDNESADPDSVTPQQGNVQPYRPSVPSGMVRPQGGARPGVPNSGNQNQGMSGFSIPSGYSPGAPNQGSVGSFGMRPGGAVDASLADGGFGRPSGGSGPSFPSGFSMGGFVPSARAGWRNLRGLSNGVEHNEGNKLKGVSGSNFGNVGEEVWWVPDTSV